MQIDGESFSVESGQRPVKVQSKLKPGTSYTLAVRLAPAQVLRLNSVRMEYEMPAKVYDDKGKDLRFVQIVHDFGFTLRITDVGHRLGAKPADKWLDTLVDDAAKRYADRKATDVVQGKPKAQTVGASTGKMRKITYKNEQGEAWTNLIFVLSGDKYTIGAEAEYRDQDIEDVKPWVMNALSSIQPVH